MSDVCVWCRPHIGSSETVKERQSSAATSCSCLLPELPEACSPSRVSIVGQTTRNRTILCSASYVSCQRGTARICCCAPCCWAPDSNLSTSPARRALNSKSASAACGGRMMGRTDGRTDRQTPDRCIDPVPYTMRAVPVTDDKMHSAKCAQRQ